MGTYSLGTYILQYESQHFNTIEPVALYANRPSSAGYSTYSTHRQLSNRCYNCEDNGHLTRNCPNPGLSKCYACMKFFPKELNHKSSNGPTKSFEYKSSN